MLILKSSVLFIGGGTASLFCAYELIKNQYNGKITIIEEGKDLKDRHCPKDITGKCIHCSTCSITHGLSGAGAFSDAKLSLGTAVGGSLPELLGEARTQALINYVDSIFLKFGAESSIVGLEDNEEVRDIMDVKVYVFTPLNVIKERWYKRAISRGKTGEAADLQFKDVNKTAQEYIRPTYQIADCIINGMVTQEYIQEITDKMFKKLYDIVG